MLSLHSHCWLCLLLCVNIFSTSFRISIQHCIGIFLLNVKVCTVDLEDAFVLFFLSIFNISISSIMSEMNIQRTLSQYKHNPYYFFE